VNLLKLTVGGAGSVSTRGRMARPGAAGRAPATQAPGTPRAGRAGTANSQELAASPVPAKAELAKAQRLAAAGFSCL